MLANFALTFEFVPSEAIAAAPFVTVISSPPFVAVLSAIIFPPAPLYKAVPLPVVPPSIFILDPFPKIVTVFPATPVPGPFEYIPTFSPVVPATNFISTA